MILMLTLATAFLQAPAAPSFDYDRTRPVDTRIAPGNVRVRQLTYAQIDGTRNAATLVDSAAPPAGPRPAILYLHWYEPPRPTSNRTEFLAEAVELAGAGAVSLLIDTPWSAEQW